MYMYYCFFMHCCLLFYRLVFRRPVLVLVSYNVQIMCICYNGVCCVVPCSATPGAEHTMVRSVCVCVLGEFSVCLFVC